MKYLILLPLAVTMLLGSHSIAEVEAGSLVQVQLDEAAVRIPLSFEANQGQADPQAKFLSRNGGYTVFLASTGSVLVLDNVDAAGATRHSAFQIQLLQGVDPVYRLTGPILEPQITGLDEIPETSNYLVGKDESRWQINVPHYAKVKYQDVYPGIDLVYHGSQRELEQDFVIAPGSDPGSIRLGFPDLNSFDLDSQGNLVLRVAEDQVIVNAPVVYQQTDERRQEISGKYMVKSTIGTGIATKIGRVVGFEIGPYDASSSLFISYSVVFAGGKGMLAMTSR